MIGQRISLVCIVKNYLNSTKYARCIRTWSLLQYPVVPFKLTDIGEGIREVTVKQWFVKPNQAVKQFQEVCEVESDKASVTITSRYDGEVKKLYCEEGDVVSVGSVLLDIETPEECKNTDAAADSVEIAKDSTKYDNVTEKESEISSTNNSKVLASPAVRRLAKEYDLDLNHIGTGNNIRIRKEDILSHLNQPPQVSEQVIVRENVESSTGYRKTMIKTMTESNTIPTLVVSDEVDVSQVEILRKNVRLGFENENSKLTLLAFVIKAVSLSLIKYPILNSSFDSSCNQIKYVSSQNIGIAMDTPSGLVVPNIKDVQVLSIRNIAAEIQRLRNLAVQTKLTVENVVNGSFTVTNIGSIAGTIFNPLILPPQTGIVAIGRVQKLPRYNKYDELQKCSIVNLSWAADHRVVDGATVARISNSVKNYLENPGLFLADA